jgi:hypothetical protein
MKVTFNRSIGASSFFCRATVLKDGLSIGEVLAVHEGARGKSYSYYTYYPDAAHEAIGIHTSDTQQELKSWLKDRLATLAWKD